MQNFQILLFAVQLGLILCEQAKAVPSLYAETSPVVKLDWANVTGLANGTLSKFLGIPFAHPPTGNLRFRAPRAVDPYNGTINASSYGAICPQQITQFSVSLTNTDIFNSSLPDVVKATLGTFANLTADPSPPPQSEDCLTINIIKPANALANASLPVVVWIFGGGFERGSAAGSDALGARIVNRSIELGQPVIYASMNYRVSAWGFLASKEVLKSGEGNMGLQDQRLALQWIQRYISVFGGDRTKVTLWGQSSGAISASLQMLAYGGNSTDLFRGAFMQSGAPVPVGNITNGQGYYDSIVNSTGCTSSNDTLACLREVPNDQLQRAVDKTPNFLTYRSLALAWTPRADGRFLTDNPQQLLQQGKFMPVPVVSGKSHSSINFDAPQFPNLSISLGNVDDEGTIFSLSSLNVTNEQGFQSYINNVFLPRANASDLQNLWSYYPQDPAAGSPYNTSDFNDITSQYKRIASFQGDAVFQAPRRFFLENLVAAGKQKVWSSVNMMLKDIPVLGSCHGVDIQLATMDDYLIQFAHKLDPNNATGPTWPEYNNSVNPQVYTFPSGETEQPFVSNDTFRQEAMRYLTNVSLKYPL